MPTPGVLEYPAALDTALSLVEVANNGSSTLTANISVSDLLIPVADPGKFSNSGFATLVDSLTAPTKIEIFVYTSKSGSNLVVPTGGRGAQGTTAFAFSTGNFVEQRPTARHHTVLRDLLIAIEQKLGIGADTPGAAVEALLSNGAGASLWRAITGADVANVVRTDLAALQTIISNLTLSKDSPSLTLTDTAGAGGTGIINVNENLMNIGRSGQSDLLIALLTGVFTFGHIPVLPASDPTTANQAVRKQYVDDRRTRWSANFFIQNPSTVTSTFALIQKGLIPGSNFVATHVGAIANTGSDSGAFIVTLRKHPFSNQSTQTDLGGVNYNPGLGVLVGVGKEEAITPHTFTANDFVYPVISAVAAPAQRDVNVYIRGYQTPQNP